MRRLLAAGAFLLCIAGPSRATEWVNCRGGEDAVSFDMLLGMLEFIAVDTIRIEAKGKRWSTRADDGALAIEVGQAFATGDQILIDVTEKGMGQPVARLRLFTAHEEAGGEGEVFDALGGVLQMPGLGAWAVSCTDP